MIFQVEPPAEECDLQIPEHRSVKYRKQACAACRGIPIIVSAVSVKVFILKGIKISLGDS